MKKLQYSKKRKFIRSYFIVRTFSAVFLLLTFFSILSVGFSSWMIGQDVTAEEQISADLNVGGLIDTSSLITYYDGNYEIPEICQDGFVVDETIVYKFDIEFKFRLRIKNIPPNRGLEYYLESAKEFVITINLYDRGDFKLLNSEYMETPPITLQVKPDSSSNYTNLTTTNLGNETIGSILTSYTYQNNDISNINYLDFILIYHFSFSKNSHFSDNENNIYKAIKDYENKPNIDRIIALENQIFVEV